jgi:hypothetical protein
MTDELEARAKAAEQALRVIANLFDDQTINQTNAIELMGDTAKAYLGSLPPPPRLVRGAIQQGETM